MEVRSIKIKDIPEILLPVTTSTKNATLWLNGNEVQEIFIFRDRFRVNTNRGQYRYGLDTEMKLDIT